MCGFFCVIGNINKNFDKQNFVKTSKLISHRGPDDFQVAYNNNFALSFYRLSLRDLSKNGRQPMRSSCGRYIICFNGEIYNSDYIKKKYLNKKKLKSSSDTEILLESFALKGENIISEIDGMFAIFIYDLYKNKSFLIRDRFGIKPFYYFLSKKNELIISSEIKPIAKFINSKKINYSAIADFFFKGTMDYDKSFLKDINFIKPGSYLIYKNKQIFENKYWSLKDSLSYNKNNVKLDLNYLLNKSVKQHLISDVKIGTFLSGGTDSSAITAIANKNLNYKLNSFTYDFIDSGIFSESDRAKLIAKKLNIYNHKLLIKPNYIINNFDNLIETVESPITSIRLFGTMMNYSFAKKKKIKVILEGQGGDEIFGGYKYNYIFYLKDKFKKMNNKNKMMKFLLKNKIFPLENEKDIMNFIVSLSYQHGSTSDGVPYINSDEFSNEFKNEYLNQEFYDVKKYSENSLKNSQFKDIYEIKLPRVLRYTDRLSMKYGIETRVPFLNHNFFEYGFNLKPNLKFKDNKSRWAFKKYIKNKFSYEKNKKTIVDPQKLWFKTYFKEMFLDTFSSTDFRNMNIFSQKNILKSYNNFLKNDSETSFNFIQIFSTYKFIKLFK